MRPVNRWLIWFAAALVTTLGGIVIFQPQRPARPTLSTPGSTTSPAAELRIVSLAPNVTEILFELGLGDRVVAACESCTWPPEAKDIPTVGPFTAPNIEKMLAARPTLVICEKAPAASANVLRGAGIKVIEVPSHNLDGVFDAFLKIGNATGTRERAEKIVAQFHADLAAVSARYKDVPPDKRPRVFIEISSDPIMTAGGPSFITDVIDRAGGVNAAGSIDEGFPTINPEKVIAWNPDVIILTQMTGTTGANLVSTRIGWNAIAAVKNHRVIDDIPEDYLLKPGPRLVKGIRMLADRLYPAEGNADAPH